MPAGNDSQNDDSDECKGKPTCGSIVASASVVQLQALVVHQDSRSVCKKPASTSSRSAAALPR